MISDEKLKELQSKQEDEIVEELLAMGEQDSYYLVKEFLSC